MLDTLACCALIQQQARTQQSHYVQQRDSARSIWAALVAKTALQERLLHNNILGFTLPIQSCYRVEKRIRHYAVCGVDGSQIYPNRHEGFSEYLVNIGTAHFVYHSTSYALLTTKPYLLSGHEHASLLSAEVVNAQRIDYELKHAVEVASHESSPVIMFDGALMFWHLQAPGMQERFAPSYVEHLRALQREQKQYLGYISASHSRELVVLLEQAAQLLGQELTFDYLVDSDIAQFFLVPGQYTQLFRPISRLNDLYPELLRPGFSYLHVGDEIARVELPAYLADDQSAIAHLIEVVLDQVEKGKGYPIALSEAHEQAVVKAVDRDFFYRMLHMHYQAGPTVSLKLSKKRAAAI